MADNNEKAAEDIFDPTEAPAIKDVAWAMYNESQRDLEKAHIKQREFEEKARLAEIKLERERQSLADRIRNLEERVDMLTKQVAQNSGLTNRLVPLK